MKKLPKVIYANRVNLSGLYSNKPLKLKLEAHYDFYSDGEDFCLDTDKIGLVETDGLVGFSSPNEKEVELWTQGAIAVMRQIFKWSKYAGEKK